MLSSTPWSSVSAVAELGLERADRARAARAAPRGRRPRRVPSAWSVIARTRQPRARAAATTSSSVERPSPETVVCTWKSPITGPIGRGSAPALGGLDLAGVLAQDGRDPGQTERRVDLLLGLARDDAAALDLGEGVLVQRQAAGERALAELDVVALRAGEVEQRGAELVRRHDAQVDLRSAVGDDAGLGRRRARARARRRSSRRRPP